MSAAFSPDSKVITATSGSILQIWDVSTGACRQRFEIPDHGTAISLTISPDGDTLAFGGGDGATQGY
jgi:WD40 repeat protein